MTAAACPYHLDKAVSIPVDGDAVAAGGYSVIELVEK